jgi:hypothetical protein
VSHTFAIAADISNPRPTLLLSLLSTQRSSHLAALLGVNQGTLGVNQGTSGVNQGTLGVNQGTSGVNQGTLGVNQGTLGVNQGTFGTWQRYLIKKKKKKNQGS